MTTPKEYVIVDSNTLSFVSAHATYDDCVIELKLLRDESPKRSFTWWNLTYNSTPDWVKVAAASAQALLYHNPFKALDPDEPIIAAKFKEGDRLTFAPEDGSPTYLHVAHVDDKHAYLRTTGASTNEYRVSRRSSELRMFDRLGWTLVKGKFTSILAGFSRQTA
jgi:hypothetical protein